MWWAEGRCKVDGSVENISLHQGHPARLSQSVEDSVARPQIEELLEVQLNQDDNQEWSLHPIT